jgi:natural product precursor
MPRAERLMKKLTLSKETLRTLDEQELTLVVGGGNASGAHNPAQCPSSHHPNCK